jgi:transcriptional regulator with XRE-family HTH domain
MTILDPKMLGFWARCLREAQHLSQEALAVASNVDVRTVQRFEAGQGVHINSRRSLAKGLGYENADIFDTPEFVTFILEFFDNIKAVQQKQLDDHFPDRIRLKAVRLNAGDQAIQFIHAVQAVSFDIDPELSDQAKEIAASFGDFLRDLIDLDDLTLTDRLSLGKSLDDLLAQLKSKGAAVYSASRDRKFRGDD